MKKVYLLCAVLHCGTGIAAAVTGKASGRTADGGTEPLVGASVFWLNTNKGTTTGEDGSFELPESAGSPAIVITYIGYRPDTIAAADARQPIAAVLTPLDAEIDEVVVAGRQKGNYMSKLNPVTTSVITKAGLQKMACCSLAESFENSAAVTIGFSDAVTGTRQIRLLGLSGAYTQMLEESRPTMRGLAATYGLEYTPGAWLEGIQISKGISSVMHGYEAVTGQINLEIRKPVSEDKLFVNAYLNNELRSELNVAATIRASEGLRGNVLAHVSNDFMKIDRNGDGFLDLPVARRALAATRWLYTFDGGAQLRTGLKFVYEDRQSGQMDFDPQKHKGDTIKYGSVMNNRQVNAYAKFGVPFGDNPYNSVAIVADYTLHSQNSYFGLHRYDALQHSVIVNGLVQKHFSGGHSGIVGISGTADVYDEDFSSSTTNQTSELLNRNEYVAGAFGEYTYHIEEKLSAIAGLRGDYNNLYGALLTPRLHLRYNIVPNLTIRASAGRGFRSVNALAGNIWMLATQRGIVAEDMPKIEDAWTYGANLTKYFTFHDHHEGESEDEHEHGAEEEKAYVSVDVFRTQFTNQVIADQEVGGSRILIYNLNGSSYANNYQIDVSVEPFERFSVLASFRYSDAKVQLREMGFVRKPLVDNFKGLLNLSYATKFNRWMFDVTAQINGQSRLPDLNGSAAGNGRPSGSGGDYSPVYPMFFAQVTRRFRGIDVYAGCENILNYMQDDPIISADSPFGRDFNASVVWGPLMGRKFYAGLRWTIGG